MGAYGFASAARHRCVPTAALPCQARSVSVPGPASSLADCARRRKSVPASRIKASVGRRKEHQPLDSPFPLPSTTRPLSHCRPEPSLFLARRRRPRSRHRSERLQHLVARRLGTRVRRRRSRSQQLARSRLAEVRSASAAALRSLCATSTHVVCFAFKPIGLSVRSVCLFHVSRSRPSAGSRHAQPFARVRHVRAIGTFRCQSICAR